MAANKLNTIRDAITTVANKLGKPTPEQQTLRLCAALLDGLSNATFFKEQMKEEEVLGPTARYINLSNDMVQQLEMVNEVHQNLSRQLRVVTEQRMAA